MSVDALMSEERNLVFSSGGDGEPMQRAEDGCDVVIFPHPHQDPRRAVLDVLEPLKALAGDPDEKCVALVQPGGDKAVD